MDPQLRARAETRLESAAADLGVADPRPSYRERLRGLRETHPDAFSRAITYYENEVLPALCEQDPLPVWLEYGRFLTALTGECRLVVIDESGLATPFTPPLRRALLALVLPDDTAEQPLIAAQPLQATPAQQATIDLLVHRRLGIQ